MIINEGWWNQVEHGANWGGRKMTKEKTVIKVNNPEEWKIWLNKAEQGSWCEYKVGLFPGYMGEIAMAAYTAKDVVLFRQRIKKNEFSYQAMKLDISQKDFNHL